MICEVDGNEYKEPDHQSPHPYSLYLWQPQIPQKPESLPFDKNTQMQFFSNVHYFFFNIRYTAGYEKPEYWKRIPLTQCKCTLATGG